MGSEKASEERISPLSHPRWEREGPAPRAREGEGKVNSTSTNIPAFASALPVALSTIDALTEEEDDED